MQSVSIHSAGDLQGYAAMSRVSVEAEVQADFRAQMNVQSLGEDVLLTEATSGRMQASRATHLDSSARDDLLFFCTHLAGFAAVRQRGRTAELSRRTGVLYEARNEWEIVFPSAIRSLTIQFPRKLLALGDREIAECCALPITSESGAFQLMSSYVSHLHGLAGTLSDEQRADAAVGAVDLLTMVLHGMTPSVPSGSGANEILFHAIEAYIRRSFRDPNLDVAELARRHHISVRRLYQLFESRGTTPAAYLRDRRLRFACAILADPERHQLSVGEIATISGFSELRTFERVFRRHHGTAPGRWRRERKASRPG